MALRYNKQIIHHLLYIILFVLLAAFLYLIRGLLVTFLITIVFVYIIHPLVSAMEARGASRVPAILIAYLGVLIVSAAFLMYGIPRLVTQLHMLVDMLPTYTAQVEAILRDIQNTYYKTQLPEVMRQAVDQQISNIEAMLQSCIKKTVEMLISLVGYSFNLILAPIVAFYILKDWEQIKNKVEEWLPPQRFPNLWVLTCEINKVVNSFIRGHLLLVLIVGLMTGTAMALLGLPYAVMLGIISGIAELIPYFGPFIGSIPAVMIALMQSKWMVLKVILAILIVQQIEGNVIAPKVLGDSVGLHPLTIILALLVGAELYGIIGMLLAVPLTAILRVIIRVVVG